MEIFSSLLDTFAYFETHMDALFLNHGRLTLWILALVIFSETAFVVTPFLPGDSLLLATGALAATGSMEFHILIIALTAAAFLGNVCNYWIGYFIGKKAFHNPKSKIFNEENLQKILTNTKVAAAALDVFEPEPPGKTPLVAWLALFVWYAGRPYFPAPPFFSSSRASTLQPSFFKPLTSLTASL